MNITDVKSALETILTLNPGISKARLQVLLQAANWEKASIDQALLLVDAIAPSLPSGEVDAEHLISGGVQKVEEKILHEERTPKEIVLDQALPSGLPIKPLEASPHVTTFSAYKDMMQKPVVENPLSKLVLEKKEVVPPSAPVFIPKEQKVEEQPKKVVYVTHAVSGSDMSLSVLAWLLGLIIVILGTYMYSNGRLFM